MADQVICSLETLYLYIPGTNTFKHKAYVWLYSQIVMCGDSKQLHLAYSILDLPNVGRCRLLHNGIKGTFLSWTID